LASSEDLLELFLLFYNKKSTVYESWLKTYWILKERTSLPNTFSPLHLASYLDVIPLAENLLSKRKGWMNSLKLYTYVNQRDGQGRTPLYWAAIKGHKAMVQLLLKHRANANVKMVREGSILHGAVVNRDETTVQLLLEHRANVKTKDSNSCTTLHMAAESGKETIAQLLLEHGADVNTKTNDHGGRV
jgi:ankyrin repeat protein